MEIHAQKQLHAACREVQANQAAKGKSASECGIRHAEEVLQVGGGVPQGCGERGMEVEQERS